MKTTYIYSLLFFFSFIFGVNSKLYSQDTTFARMALKKLCSEEFGGRGYVDDGNKIAANYIAANFQSFGLKAFTKDYFQEFDFQINTIESLSYFIANDDTLVPGVDYYISNASEGRNGEFDLQFIDDSLFANDGIYLRNILMMDLSKTFLVFKSSHNNVRYKFKTKVAGLIFLHDKSIGYWHFSNAQAPVNYAIIDAIDSLIPANTKSINIKFRNKFYKKYKTQNIVGFIKGKKYPDSIIAITAHYDHMGKMGKDVYFPGANDNASGTVMMMNLAKYFSDSLNQPDYSLVFMSFSGEEVGLLGSQYYVRNPLFELNKIKMLLNLDMVGTGSNGIKVVNASVYKKEFNRLRSINKKQNYLKAVKSRGESCNSDHCPFYMKAVPSFFIYTLGDEYKEYHTITDRAEDLPLTKYSELFKLLRDYIVEFK